MERDLTIGDTVVNAPGETYEWKRLVNLQIEDVTISEIHAVSEESGTIQELGLIDGTGSGHG